MIINKNGLQLDSFDDLYQNLVTAFQNIYGEDINLSQDTPDGQILGIFTTASYDMQTMLARIYNAFDPDFAEGHELDKIMKLIATTRLPATKSIVDVEITSNANIELYDGYTLKDVNEQEWIIKTPQTIEADTPTLITFEAVEWGSIEALSNTIAKQVTIIPEVTNVTNPQIAVVGRDEETDTDLRIRRNRILGYTATSLISSILGKILALEDVKDCTIYENNTSNFDEVKFLNANSLWVIVEGGDITEIAQIIATDKTIGAGLKGNITATYTETFTRSNGSIREFIHEVKFDRPTYTNFYIRFKVKKRNSLDIIDTDKIKQVLETINFNIAQNITATELYSYIYQAGDNFIAYELELSLDNENWVDDILSAGYSDKFIILSDNIDIIEE